MSWKATAYIKTLVECPNGERINKSEKLVGLVLADSHQDRGKAYTFPAVETIAEDALMGLRQCQRILASLERKGVITRERPPLQYRGVTTYYRFPALDAEPGPSPQKGDTGDTLLFPKGGRKDGSKDGSKDDKTGPAYKEEQEHEQKQQYLTPTPFLNRKGEVVFEADVVSTTNWVCGECRFNSKPIKRAVATALQMEKNRGEDVTARGKLMVENYGFFVKNTEFLKFKWGLVRFFAEGHWLNVDGWPYDEERIRRAREAAVGARR